MQTQRWDRYTTDKCTCTCAHTWSRHVHIHRDICTCTHKYIYTEIQRQAHTSIWTNLCCILFRVLSFTYLSLGSYLTVGCGLAEKWNLQFSERINTSILSESIVEHLIQAGHDCRWCWRCAVHAYLPLLMLECQVVGTHNTYIKSDSYIRR